MAEETSVLQRPTMLVIEDDPGDIELLRGLLVHALPPGFTLVHADRLATGLARLAVGDIDVVLLDLSLPDGQGMSTLHTLQAQRLDVPVVILTGYDDALAIQAVQAGVQDYLVAVSVACQELLDLLPLDIGLPIGDGFQVIEQLRPLFSADIPIIVLSGRDLEHNVARVLPAGAQAFFQKPADNEELFAAIRDVLGEATQQIPG
jgi:DNA-binding response OmpR family regulator